MAVSGKLIRRTALVVLILTGLVFCALTWVGFAQFKPMIMGAIMFTGIYLFVLVMEIIAALVGYKKTVSTRWKHWAKEHPVLSWVALGLFWVAMTALVVHLGVYW